MPYTTKWQIEKLAREFKSGYVFKVFFAVEAFCKTTNTSHVLKGSQCLDRPETLIPYENLTENLVLDWLYAALGENQVCRLNEQVSTDLKCYLETCNSKPPWLESTTLLSKTIQKGVLT
jgi:hypothetical protein